jgi:hypothetical protein
MAVKHGQAWDQVEHIQGELSKPVTTILAGGMVPKGKGYRVNIGPQAAIGEQVEQELIDVIGIAGYKKRILIVHVE